MKILGIDPSLRGTGYGIIELKSPSEYQAVDFGVIRNPTKFSQSQCFQAIRDKLQEILTQYSVSEAATESIIYLQNHSIAITLGGARAVCLLTCADMGITLAEYAPRRVKMGATGVGSAGKHQVGFMVRSLLKLTKPPPADAADALAVAITHAQALRQKPLQKVPKKAYPQKKITKKI